MFYAGRFHACLVRPDSWFDLCCLSVAGFEEGVFWYVGVRGVNGIAIVVPLLQRHHSFNRELTA